MDALQKNIAYTFQNINLLKEALTLAHGNKAARYERLEFLGDRVIGLVVADMLLSQHKKEKEGDIAKRFTALVIEETLADIARQINLPAALITDSEDLRNNNSVLADVMEALAAAIFKDGGLSEVYTILTPLFSPLLDKDIRPPIDSKTALQEWGHKHKILMPEYKVVEQTGPAHAPNFKVCVKMSGFKDVFHQYSVISHSFRVLRF